MEEIRDLSDCELKTEEDLVQILQQLHHKHQNYVSNRWGRESKSLFEAVKDGV